MTERNDRRNLIGSLHSRPGTEVLCFSSFKLLVFFVVSLCSERPFMLAQTAHPFASIWIIICEYANGK
ncbi:unnamed protein product [Amoebophrya sp. A25]|nr:unnamed protein product [Amoebophrya sp. A25]|eukprot:GSA25T00026190001.1